jgi:pimeloyl-ACP methyl ester carboxylesterase
MMKRALLVLLVPLTLLSGFTVATLVSPHAAAASGCVPASGTNTLHGTLNDANYTIAVPANWNGTLVLYSHGYTPAFVPLANPAPDAPSAQTSNALLQEGYALAGSSYSQNGWALQQAFHDDFALLDFFTATCGHPNRTIPWGSSMGGMITAGLVQLDPRRFAGALPMCGLLSGSVGLFNLQLDGLFTFNLLLANGALQVVNFTNPNAELSQAESILTAAQQTPEGRARIALFSSLEDVPGWFTPGSPEPTQTDYASQEQNQYLAAQVDLFFDIDAMAEAEERAGGNYSWNTGVNYFRQFALSIDRREVEGLYGQAGLNLFQDLKTIQEAPRISADASAVTYMKQYIVFNGDLDIPVLTMHTTGDPLVFVQTEQAYASVVREAGDASLLRQVFVQRAGHCAFTDAEMLTALHTLIHRLDTGHWGNATDPTLMNDEAAQFGANFNAFPPAFLHYEPAVFLRPFDVSEK